LLKLILISFVDILCSQYTIDYSDFTENEMNSDIKALSLKQNNSKYCYWHVSHWICFLWWINIFSFMLICFADFLSFILISAWTSDISVTFITSKTCCFQKYLYLIFCQHENGEYALTQLLDSEAFVMLSLDNWISQIVLSQKISVTLIYDSNDWIDVEMKKRISRSVQTSWINSEKKSEIINFYIIFDISHHVFLKNLNTFNNILKFELQKCN